MKIVPILTGNGPMYKVVKWTVFGSKYMSENGMFYRDSDNWFLAFNPPKLFPSVIDAVKEIREQFGKKAKITFWEGK